MLRIRRVLDAEGITVKTVAELLGCSEKTVKNKTAGRSDFTYREARLLKGLLPKYDLDYLLSDDVPA